MTNSQTPALPPLDWQVKIAPGDIVAFRFPHETDGSELAKVRPTLVLDVADLGDMRSVTLAYCTTQRPKIKRRDHVIVVSRDVELSSASLRARTYVNVERRITVSPRNPGFEVNSVAGTPVLGRLSGWSLAEMKRIRLRLQAERDMTRERLRQRRKTSSRHLIVYRRKNGVLIGREIRHV